MLDYFDSLPTSIDEINILMKYLALDVTANCICEIHFLTLDGLGLNFFID